MTRALGGLVFVLAVALSIPALAAKNGKHSSGAAAGGDTSASSASTASGDEMKGPSLSKDEQAKLREHMKMRNFLSKDVKYPASKADITSKMKKTSIKADDKKWFEQTLPEKTFTSAEDVYQSLGWDVSAPGKGSGAESK